MEFVKTKTIIDKRNITSLKYPVGSKASILTIRKEKSCWFCGKKYEDSQHFGVVMTNKGSKICCDDCCELFKDSGVNIIPNH